MNPRNCIVDAGDHRDVEALATRYPTPSAVQHGFYMLIRSEPDCRRDASGLHGGFAL
jgi:hypothetical protein